MKGPPRVTMASLSQITTRVGSGRVAPRPAKRAAKVGMTFHRITATTAKAITMTATG